MSVIRLFTPLAVSLLMSIPATAREPLPEEQHIVNSLVAGRIGDVIRKNCPTIDARMFRVWRGMEDLKKYALAKGYKEQEIRAFLKDPVQKQRMRAMADDWLKKAGAVPGDAESYCRIGRDQIAKNTLLGSLLKSRK